MTGTPDAPWEFETRDSGLVSTTLWRPIARRFGQDLMAIVLPRGAPAAWLEEISPRNEFEVLLQTDCLFQIVAFEERDGGRIPSVKLVGRAS